MKIDGGSDGLAQAYAVRVEKLSQDSAKAQGKAAVELIESASQAPSVGPNGEGSRVNTYA